MLPFIILGAATLFSAAATIISAQEQKKQAEYNAQYQADKLAKEAEYERNQANLQAMEERRRARRQRAAIEAAYASSGVTLEGTPTSVLAQQAADDELGALVKESASGYKHRLQTNEAENALILGNATAKSYGTAGITTGVGTLLSGATQAAFYANSLTSKNQTNQNSKAIIK